MIYHDEDFCLKGSGLALVRCHTPGTVFDLTGLHTQPLRSPTSLRGELEVSDSFASFLWLTFPFSVLFLS